MKRTYLLSLGLSLCLGLVAITTSAKSAAQKPVKIAAVPLAVTIENLGPTGPFIQSDCWETPGQLCPYVNGQDGVEANIDGGGNLIFYAQARRRGALRRVYIDYGNPPQISPLSSPSEGAPAVPQADYQDDGHVVTWPTSGAPYTPPQNMTIGQEQCIGLAFTYTVNGTSWRNNYRYRNNFPPQSNFASYAVITRIDDNTWEVEPKLSSCNDGNQMLAEVTSLPSSGVLVTSGLYQLPFKLTLRRKL
jgi:hypothetical protein